MTSMGKPCRRRWRASNSNKAGHEPGMLTFVIGGAGMKMGEFPFDNSSHYTNLHAIYLSRVLPLGCISGKKCPFRQRAAGYSQPCAWTSLKSGYPQGN